MITRDLLWKGIIKDLTEDFIRLFFPEATPEIDFTKAFEFLDKELTQLLVAGDTSHRIVDLLVKVHFQDGKERWFLIHIEVQGYADEHFSKRMFVYYYRILDRFDKQVTSLAILTDDNDHFHPEKYETMFLGTRLSYEFNTYKLSKKKEDDFNNRENIFSLILETAWLGLSKNRKGDEALFHHAMQLKRRLIEDGFPKEKIRKAL